MSLTKDVIVLIPGFLGFEQIGGFYYFADRVGAAIRGALTARGHDRVQVVPANTRPSDHLHERQEHLLALLDRLDRVSGDARFHLVGHSTGGTDALLLRGVEPVSENDTWQQLDPRHVREKIRTAVAIGSPHHGTCLATGDLAQFFLNPFGNLLRLGSVARVAVYLIAAARGDAMARSIVAGALRRPHAAQRYILAVVSARGLVDDLRPAKMSELHRRFQPDLPRCRFRSFVTMAGRPVEAPEENPDKLFEYLYEQTGGERGSCGGGDEDDDRVGATIEYLNEVITNQDAAVIQNPGAQPRPIEPGINDGIVNSARQLYNPDSEEELAGVVVGDHFDVLGYFPYGGDLRGDQGRRPLQAGILHSGSRFKDDQFFKLYARVAAVISGQLSE